MATSQGVRFKELSRYISGHPYCANASFPNRIRGNLTYLVYINSEIATNCGISRGENEWPADACCGS